MEQAVHTLKKEVRKLLKSRLRNLPVPYCRTASQEIFQKVEGMQAYQRSTTIFCFLSMPQEVQTMNFIDRCFHDGKRIFVPKIVGSKSSDMQVLELMSISDIETFPKNSWGIPEPSSELDEASWRALAFAAVDLVIVPGVGFDANCRRMGHGNNGQEEILSCYY